MTFDPNDSAVANGNFFGLPFSREEAQVVIVPVPWDVTTSYRAGTNAGPAAMLDASLQIDLYDLDYGNRWEKGIATTGINKSIEKLNQEMRKKATIVMKHIENGGDVHDADIQTALSEVNAASAQLNQWVYAECWQILAENKVPAVLGGDHSTPYGLIKALAEKYDSFGILQIDAHADLREAYEGFTFSHASIMFNAFNFKPISRLLQVGVRDLCEEEISMINSEKDIRCFFDSDIAYKLFKGVGWDEQCREIIELLPEKVYISFDIDGLDPSLCPNTGTPVPGGLSFQQVTYLLKNIHDAGKTVIGFDLCEVASGDIDAITGARILYKLCNLAIATQ